MKIYQFKVTLPAAGNVWRRIEMRAEHSLEDLHLMIQAAFDWENDHLYSFFLSNKPWDASSEYTLPESEWEDDLPDDWDDDDNDNDDDNDDDNEWDDDELEPIDPEQWGAMSEDEKAIIRQDFADATGMPGELLDEIIADLLNPEDAERSGHAPGSVRTTKLSDLNLKEGQKFLYIFDFGDEHRFTVELEKIIPFSDPDALYPAITDGEGEDPEQYPEWSPE